MIAITPIPAFNDNYLWLISNNKDAVIVDPGDAAAVSQHLAKNQLNLVGILITHHHADHTAGIKVLKDQYDCPVWGPINDPVKHLDHCCAQNDRIEIPQMDLKLKVISVPGHTLGHIAYFIEETIEKTNKLTNSLFCGDTLFSGGCGRLFEGTATQMWQSIQKLMDLPLDTQIYPAHEYTLANLKFALQLEPNNQDLINYIQAVETKRANKIPSLPTNLKTELLINPFMRIKQPTIISAAKAYSSFDLKSGIMPDYEVFSAIRQWKDNF